LFALGGALPDRRALAPFPKSNDGWLPINSYLLRDGDSFLVVDTGIPAHWPAISANIKRLTHDCRNAAAVVTRREPDSMINLPVLVGEFAIRTVYAGGALSPLDFFDGLDEANGIAQIRETSGVSPAMLQPGAIIPVGELEVEVLPAPLRVLFTNWLYEHKTKTLFSSDSWGFLSSREICGPFVVQPSDEDISEARILAYLETKFDWMQGIDCAPVIGELHDVLGGRDIARICPGFGGIIEGSACATVIDRTLDALRTLQSRPRINPLDGFAWPPKGCELRLAE
jgi:hypothetical protein